MSNNVKFRHPFAEKINFVTDRKVIICSNIMEYDITKANINILKAYGIITEDVYNTLSIVDKRSREVYIGKLIASENYSSQNNSVSGNCIKEGIALAKDRLLYDNKIQPSQIVRIANDAVYVERPIPLQYSSFDILNNGNIIKFLMKEMYSSFINLKKVLVFFRIESDENFIVDVKGISDELLPLHQPFLEFIVEILFYLERTDIPTTLSVFNDFYEKYINMLLPVGYYREFNNESSFRIKASTKNYGVRFIDESKKNFIDIDYNLSVLRELYSIILNSR